MNKQSPITLRETIIPVILAGGPGYRLKPWSRPSCPKPFLKIRGRSLLQETLLRVMGTRPLVLCHQSYVTLAQSQARAVHPGVHFLVESSMKNTGPAIAAAAAHIIHHHGPQTVMLILPSDHAIDNTAVLREEINKAEAAMGEGIISFGIRPRSPSQRYGYIVVQDNHTRFIEKPDKRKAQTLRAQGACWNSGIWMARAGTVRDAYKVHAPVVWDNAVQAVTYERHEPDVSYLESRAYDRNPAGAVDLMIMEKYPAITCHPLAIKWRDLGTWPSMIRHLSGF